MFMIIFCLSCLLAIPSFFLSFKLIQRKFLVTLFNKNITVIYKVTCTTLTNNLYENVFKICDPVFVLDAHSQPFPIFAPYISHYISFLHILFF